jgi:hypothetical protein
MDIGKLIAILKYNHILLLYQFPKRLPQCQVFSVASSLVTVVEKSIQHKRGFGYIFDTSLKTKLQIIN